jgi:prepilin-type processing-associated H-X9-DG protein
VPSQFRCPHCGGENDMAGQTAGRKPSFSGCGLSSALLFVGAIILIDVVAVGIGLLLPAVQAAREAARRINCQSNLTHIATAMQCYSSKYGCFPPAFVADKNGKPMHSWRALLLPYLDESLSAKYDFNEPWDGPNNRKITDVALSVYHCPSQPDSKQPTTNYMMVVGPHTISDGPHSRKQAEITDGSGSTIMLVEVADSDVPWAEPKDLSFDQLDFKINGSERPGIGSVHSGGATVAFFDGSVRFLPDTTKPERIKAMLTIGGGEKLPAEPPF